MNYIITKHPEFFKKIGKYDFCSLEEMKLKETLALDTETTGLFPRSCDIFCVQIGTKENNYIIHMYDENYEFKDLAPYLDKKILIFHNALFDLGFMYKYGCYPKEVRDTMIASKVLYNGQFEEVWSTKQGRMIWMPVRHNFGACMKRELDKVYDKTTQKNIHLVKLSMDSTIQYSFNDVDRLEELHDALVAKMMKAGQMETYVLHCRFIKALAYMEQCGLPIKPEKWKAKMIQDIKDTDEWQLKIEEYIFNTLPQFADSQIDMFDIKKRILIKITSPKQMLKVFAGYDIPTKDKDGKDSIKEDIISKSKHPFVDMWLHYQGAKHRVTTFGAKIYDQIEDNRVYTQFNPMVDTARLSSRRGSINFLNFPSDEATRDAFECSTDQRMIVCDWSGQETVIAADFSADEAMTKSVIEGADLHCLLARVLFPELIDMTDDEIQTKHKDKRTASKAPRFAMSYGGNAYTLHMNEGIPMKRAQEIEVGFRDLHEGLYKWGHVNFLEAVLVGYIQSVDGWRLKLPKFGAYIEGDKAIKAMSRHDWLQYSEGKKEFNLEKEFEEKDDEVYKVKNEEAYDYYRFNVRRISQFFKLKSAYQRLCLNSPVQTAGSHQLKLAIALYFEWIVENDMLWKILICNSVHDEVVVETHKDLAEDARAELERCMLEGGDHYLRTLKIKADAHIGMSWYEAK
jgi:DNA polymerase I-like protein with 3'-5' exonuclease and polymerase domains